MKRYLAYIIMLCMAGLFISPVKAQQKIAMTEVKKIILDCGSGSIPRGGNNNEVEVLNEQGKWNSYQTGVDETDSQQPERDIHSVDRAKLGTLTNQQIASFLNCLAVVKPTFDAKAYNITPAELINEIKQKAKDTANNTIQLSDFITEANVQRALKNAMEDFAVDTYEYCRIRIVESNNDTLKIETDHSHATMLPWAVNQVDTYDMGISDFFIAAMFGHNYPTTAMLSLHHLKDNIYHFIEAYYPEQPISTYRMKYCCTDNLKLLKANFKPDFKFDDKPGFDNQYNVRLMTNNMPSNMYIYTYIDPENREAILGLISYSKKVEQCLKQNNFALKFYSNNTQYTISFSYYYFRKSSNNLPLAAVQIIPELKKIGEDQVLSFYVSQLAKPMVTPDLFFLLPDNKFVMGHRYPNKPDNAFIPVFPPDTPKANIPNSTVKYVLFNADGIVVNKD